MIMFIDGREITAEDLEELLEEEIVIEVVCNSKVESDIFLQVLEDIGYFWESGAKPPAYCDYFNGFCKRIYYLIDSTDNSLLYGRAPTKKYVYTFSVNFEDETEPNREDDYLDQLHCDYDEDIDWVDTCIEEIHDEGPHGDQCTCDKCSSCPKPFTKDDLRSGDILIYKNGQEDVYIKELESMIVLETIENECKEINIPYSSEIAKERMVTGYNCIKDFNEDLTYIFESESDYNIEKVYRPNSAREIAYPNSRKEENYVFIRKHPARMTLKEVCEALGYDVIIVD